MNQFILIAQIVVSVLLGTAILLQQRGEGLGGAFGGSGESYSTKRGLQKKLYWTTMVMAAIFVVLAVANLLF